MFNIPQLVRSKTRHVDRKKTAEDNLTPWQTHRFTIGWVLEQDGIKLTMPLKYMEELWIEEER
jgi:hypothetical protein